MIEYGDIQTVQAYTLSMYSTTKFVCLPSSANAWKENKIKCIIFAENSENFIELATITNLHKYIQILIRFYSCILLSS